MEKRESMTLKKLENKIQDLEGACEDFAEADVYNTVTVGISRELDRLKKLHAALKPTGTGGSGPDRRAGQ